MYVFLLMCCVIAYTCQFKQEWTQEKRARFGLVRTMSERCLDRKSVQEVVLPVEPATAAVTSTTTTAAAATTEESDETSATAESAFAFEHQPTTSGLKLEQRGREALWDLFQSECAFLYDHLMVLKNVSVFLRSFRRKATSFFLLVKNHGILTLDIIVPCSCFSQSYTIRVLDDRRQYRRRSPDFLKRSLNISVLLFFFDILRIIQSFIFICINVL